MRPVAVNRNRRPTGFTLIEVLIVVIIISVLAAVMIPQFTDSTRSARDSTLKHSMYTLQSMIELYRTGHQGSYPTIQSGGLPQLTGSTKNTGEIGSPGPDYPLGPYIVRLPPNPFDKSDKVTAVATPGATPSNVSGNAGGWQYDVSTGGIWPNNPEYFQ